MTKPASHIDSQVRPQREIRWRPFLKTLIKSGVMLSRNVQTLGANLFAGTTELFEEAKAELDQEQSKKAKSARASSPDTTSVKEESDR